MRKLVPVLMLVGLMACHKECLELIQENPVTKKLEYHIFAAKDYSAPVYAHIKVDVRLQIRKMNYKTGDMELLWDSSFATKNITDYPQYMNKTIIQKFYPVYESKEKLNASYVIKYDDNGYISQQALADDVVPGEMSTSLEVNL